MHLRAVDPRSSYSAGPTVWRSGPGRPWGNAAWQSSVSGAIGVLLAEYLGRLVSVKSSWFIRIYRPTNLPRMVDATGWGRDECGLVANGRPDWMQHRAGGSLRQRSGNRQNASSARLIRGQRSRLQGGHEGRSLRFAKLKGATTCSSRRIATGARLLFNAVVHQFLIPGSQVGSRIKSDMATGSVEHVHTVTRWVLPDVGCLVCNEQINAARLQEESISGVMRARQKYTDDPDVVAPSVITLNASTAAQAANDFLFSCDRPRSPMPSMDT